MKNIRKRVLSLALSLVLALAMVFSTFAMVQTAYADTEESTSGMVLGSDVLGNSVNTANAQTVYYAGTAWRVIAYNGTGNNALKSSTSNIMTLLASDNLSSIGTTQFSNNLTNVSGQYYSNSSLKSKIDNYWNGNAFSSLEKTAVVPRTLTGGAVQTTTAPYANGVAGSEVNNASLWPLSTQEAYYLGYGDNTTGSTWDTNNELWKAGTWWWLRSPGTHKRNDSFGYDYYVSSADNTSVSFSGDKVNLMGGVRPAFNINLSSIMFSSLVSGTAGSAGAEYTLTLEDPSQTISISSGNTITRDSETQVTIPYTISGDSNHVSLLITNSSDTWTSGTGWSDGAQMQYYTTAVVSEDTGTVTFTIPGNFDANRNSWQAWIIPEIVNTGNYTDYAGIPVAVDIPPAHTHSFTYSASGATITATCANADGKCPLTDRKAILTIAANGGTYDGTTSFGATITDENSIQGEAKVKYQKKTGESSYDTETETAPTYAGTYKASITLGPGTDGKTATASVEYTIAKADITPEVNIEGWDYGSDPNTPSVTAESNPGGGEVTYKYYTDEECTKKTTSAQGAKEEGGVPSYGGDYWVEATVAETANYKSGTGTKEFTINATAITVTGLKGDSKVYDGNTTATLDKYDAELDGVKPGDEVRIASATGTFDNKNVGADKNISSITIVLEGKDAGGYKATANPATVSGAITAKTVKVTGITAADKTYDGNEAATLTFTDASFEGLVKGDTLSVKGKTTQDGTFDDKNVGNGKTVTLPELELSGADAGNYTIKTDSQTTATAAITAKEVSVTAANKSKTYLENDPALTYTADGLIAGDTFTGALTRDEGEDAGTYDINQGTLSAGNNYTIKYTKGTFTINKATTNSVTASIEGWTYGDNPKTPSATATYGQDTATFAYSDAADGTYTEKVPTDAGTWYVKATVPETDNYAGAVSDPEEFTIEKKEVGLEWADIELTYNGEAQKPKAAATGLVGQDECEVTVDGAKTDANAKSGEDSYTATAISLSNDNYKLPDNTTTEFTIVPKKLTQAMISLDSDIFKHDGTEKSPVVSMTDPDITEEDQAKQMVEGEDYTLSGDVKSSDLGTHLIAAKGEGNYTGSIETSWMMYSKKSSEKKEEGTDGKGDFEVFVDIENNTSTLTVDNLNISMAKGFLTQEDMARYNEGENVLVYMIFKEQPESEVESTDSSLLGGLFRTEGATDIAWYDITVWKKIGNSAATEVHNTVQELSMSVEVPDIYKAAPEGYTREFYFGRSHDGAATMLAQTSSVKIGFSSSKFSTYALALKDTNLPDDGLIEYTGESETDDGSGSGSSKGGANTGDANNMTELMLLMLASSGLLGAIGYRRRRETDK